MARIPINTNTTEFLIENAPDEEQVPSRGYLGMSGLGDECKRKIWYGFRFASRSYISPRIKRIFERGNIEEKRIIKELKHHGIKVFKIEDGKRTELFGYEGESQEEIVGFAGHSKGHPDGRVLGLPESPEKEHLLEIKTMNDSNFKALKKEGVKASKPEYYCQVQKYMSEMKDINGKQIDRALFIATNKNDESRYYERIKLDKDYAEDISKIETHIIMSDQPAAEKFSRAYFKCKWCNHFDVCHNDEPPKVTCRSCEHVDMGVDGKWLCGLNNDKELSLEDQLKACPSYRRLF